jgi:hypothetical protein
MKTLALPLGLLALLAVGCDDPTGGEMPDDALGDADRGPLGKADQAGSCEGEGTDHCGGQSAGSCYCDDECEAFGDCCHDKAAVCDAIEPPPAAQWHETKVYTPSAATLPGERYSDLALDEEGRANVVFHEISSWTGTSSTYRHAVPGESGPLTIAEGEWRVSPGRMTLVVGEDVCLFYRRKENNARLRCLGDTTLGENTFWVPFDAQSMDGVTHMVVPISGGGAKYARHGFGEEALPTSEDVDEISIALDAEGTPQVAWLEDVRIDGKTHRRVVHATRGSSGWSASRVAEYRKGSGGGEADVVSIALGPSGEPVIAYSSARDKSVYVAELTDNGGWESQLVEVAYPFMSIDSSSPVVLRADREGRLHIAYHAEIDTPNVRYGVYDGGEWTLEDVAGSLKPRRGQFELQIGAQGQPHILVGNEYFTKF